MIKSLPERLLAVIPWLAQDDFVADIGSDHGYLAIYLAHHQCVKGIYAVENKHGPFSRLKRNIREAGYEEVIQIALADGLENLPPQVNTLILTGLGGELIYQIFTREKEKLSQIKKIIVAPQSHLAFLRKRLCEFNFKITHETIIYEGGHYYPLLVLAPGQEELSEMECEFGPLLLKARLALFLAMLEEEKLRKVRLLEEKSLPLNRRKILQQEIEKLDNILRNEVHLDD
ncbi:MAG: tRNA (adenine(22)-N(1))-methyltransferase [Bacilli bacterium]